MRPAVDRKRTAGAGKAGLWVVSGRLAAKLCDFGTLLVLARLLVPADFGLVAIALSVVQIAETVFQVPVMQGLIRGGEPDKERFATAFTLAVLRGALLMAILVMSAWPLSVIYKDDRLFWLIAVLSLAPAARGMLSPCLATYMRRMDFRPQFVIEFAGKVLSVGVAVVAGVVFRSYWALAAATLTTPLVMMVLSYILAPYRPQLSLKAWGEFSDIVVWSSVGQVVAALNWQMDKLLLGRFVPPAVLGRYSVGLDLSMLAQQAIVQPLSQPIMSKVAKHEADRSELRVQYLALTNLLMLGVAPLLVGLCFYASPFVRFAFGEKWLEVVPFLQALAIIAIGSVPIWVLPPVATVLRQTRLVAMRLWWEFVFKLPVMLIGVVYFGIWGAIAGRALSAVAVLLVTMMTSKKMLGLGLWQQVWALVRPSLSLFAMALILYAGEVYSQSVDGIWSQLAVLIVFAGGSIVVYGMSVFFFWRLFGRPQEGEVQIGKVLGALVLRVRGRGEGA